MIWKQNRIKTGSCEEFLDSFDGFLNCHDWQNKKVTGWNPNRSRHNIIQSEINRQFLKGVVFIELFQKLVLMVWFEVGIGFNTSNLGDLDRILHFWYVHCDALTKSQILLERKKSYFGFSTGNSCFKKIIWRGKKNYFESKKPNLTFLNTFVVDATILKNLFSKIPTLCDFAIVYCKAGLIQSTVKKFEVTLMMTSQISPDVKVTNLSKVYLFWPF